MKKTKIIEIKERVCNLFIVFNLLLKLKKSYLIVIITLSIFIAIIPFITLLLSQLLLNSLQNGNVLLNELIGILVIYITFQFFGAMSNVLNTYIQGKYNEYASCELSKYFDRLCSKLSIRDFENDNIYDMIQRAEYEMGMRPITVLNHFISLINGIFGISFSIIILINWHIWILIGFIILPIACFKYFKIVSEIEYKTIYERTSVQRKSWYLTYLLTKDYYIKEVRTLGLTNFLLKEKFKIKDLIFNQNTNILKKKSKFKLLYQFLNFLFLFAIILIALMEAYNKTIMIGNFTTYITTSSKVENYINVIADSLFNLYSDSLYCSNIVTFIEHVNQNYKSNKEGIRINDKITTIQLKNVSYKYPNTNQYALKNINLSLSSNDIVAFVGENGSGKTTLIKIILGLYTDYEGEILINDKELKEIDHSDYLNRISTIFQDYNNYEFTVQENIRYGDPKHEVSFETMLNAAKLTRASDFIEKLPKAYNQQVGNWFAGGVQLSGGQWQKLALARGLVKKSDVYIFDEPTSSLDPTSEFHFFKNMLEVFKNNIGLFVTHRFINAKLANKILVFKDGNIIEIGSHEDLIKNKRYYYNMYILQQEGIKTK